MDKEIFLKLSVEKQIEEFNKLIKAHGSITKAAKIIDIDRKTLKNRFRKDGYEFDHEANQYVKDTNIQLEGQTSLIRSVEANKQDSNAVEIKENNLVDITRLEQIVNRIIDERLNSLNKTKKSSIELSSKCDGDVKYRSYGVYLTVSDEFDQYTEKHNLYSKVQLVSQSLIEFMERHK